MARLEFFSILVFVVGCGRGTCPEYGAGSAAGALEGVGVTEASGLAVSRTQDVLWLHNDAGSGARLDAVGLGGEDLVSYDVLGADAVDWEDIAVGPDGYLFIGDIGDNEAVRDDIVVYRATEPAVAAGSAGLDSAFSAEPAVLTYPDGPRDAEALAVDATGTLYILTKDAGSTEVYSAAWADGELTLETTLAIEGQVTAADISPDGETFAVATYDGVWLWTRPQSGGVAEWLGGEPCLADLAEPAEAVGLDASGFWSVSEGVGSTLYRYTAAAGQ